jgi:hypothetical protein
VLLLHSWAQYVQVITLLVVTQMIIKGQLTAVQKYSKQKLLRFSILFCVSFTKVLSKEQTISLAISVVVLFLTFH